MQNVWFFYSTVVVQLRMTGDAVSEVIGDATREATTPQQIPASVRRSRVRTCKKAHEQLLKCHSACGRVIKNSVLNLNAASKKPVDAAAEVIFSGRARPGDNGRCWYRSPKTVWSFVRMGI